MTYCLVCRKHTPPKEGDGKTCFYCGNPKRRRQRQNGSLRLLLARLLWPVTQSLLIATEPHCSTQSPRIQSAGFHTPAT